MHCIISYFFVALPMHATCIDSSFILNAEPNRSITQTICDLFVEQYKKHRA